MNVRQINGSGFMKMQVDICGKDVIEAILKSKKASKYYEQVVSNPNFKIWTEKLWRSMKVDFSLEKYRELVIDKMMLDVFAKSLSIGMSNLSISIEDVICSCFENGVKVNGETNKELSMDDIRKCFKNPVIGKAFSNVLNDEDVNQHLLIIRNKCSSPDEIYEVMDNILFIAFHNGCVSILFDLSLSIEQAMSNALNKESVIASITQMEELLFTN